MRIILPEGVRYFSVLLSEKWEKYKLIEERCNKFLGVNFNLLILLKFQSTLSNTSFGKSNNSSSISGTSSNVGNMGNENPTHSAAYNPVNLHKELLAIQAAAASAASKKPSHSSGSGNNSGNTSSMKSSSSSSHHANSMSGNNPHLAGIVQSSSKDKNGSANASLNSLNSLSQFSSLGLNSQQSMQAAMNALAASNSAKVKDYMSSGILR